MLDQVTIIAEYDGGADPIRDSWIHQAAGTESVGSGCSAEPPLTRDLEFRVDRWKAEHVLRKIQAVVGVRAHRQ